VGCGITAIKSTDKSFSSTIFLSLPPSLPPSLVRTSGADDAVVGVDHLVELTNDQGHGLNALHFLLGAVLVVSGWVGVEGVSLS